MKKYIALLCTSALILSLAGCSGSSINTTADSSLSDSAEHYAAEGGVAADGAGGSAYAPSTTPPAAIAVPSSTHTPESGSDISPEFAPTDIITSIGEISPDAAAKEADGTSIVVFGGKDGVFNEIMIAGSEIAEDTFVESPPKMPWDNQPDPQAGLLTGGEWRDNDHWHDWLSLYQTKEEWNSYKETWRCDINERIEITILSDGQPIEHAKITCDTTNSAVTDNSGKAYLFGEDISGSFTVSYDESIVWTEEIADGTSSYTVNLEGLQEKAKKLDLMIMCDTTGSMSDELSYLQYELDDVVTRIKSDNANINTRVSVNFYRDEGDEYVVREYPFTEDITNASAAISEQEANGGGDTPEAVHTALNSAINNHKWDEDAVKIMFLVLDAPPHYDEQIIDQVNSLTEQAAEMGIRIIPVAASGVDPQTEFLLRVMAFTTGGTYTFLTDDSGIGAGHEEPTIGSYEVEMLNDMMVRIVNGYLA